MPVPSHGLLSITAFVDQLFISSPGSLSTTYRWTPTIHLAGTPSWTENMASPDTALWVIGLASAQGVKTASDTKYTYTSTPDIYPGNGGPIDLLVTLPEIDVPANEWFNYRFSFLVNARVFTSGNYSVSASQGDFLGTLRFVGLDIKDMAGNSLPFNIQSASGSAYTADGIAAIPEPSTTGLAGVGMLLLALNAARRRKVANRRRAA
jgi:hypothetical protein